MRKKNEIYRSRTAVWQQLHSTLALQCACIIHVNNSFSNSVVNVCVREYVIDIAIKHIKNHNEKKFEFYFQNRSQWPCDMIKPPINWNRKPTIYPEIIKKTQSYQHNVTHTRKKMRESSRSQFYNINNNNDNLLSIWSLNKNHIKISKINATAKCVLPTLSLSALFIIPFHLCVSYELVVGKQLVYMWNKCKSHNNY